MLYSEQPAPNEEGGTAEGGAPAEGGLTEADFDSNWDEAIESFDAMELPEELLRGIYSYGFEKPSAIQQRAIKPTILGRDLIAQAQSGTVCIRVHVVLVFAPVQSGETLRRKDELTVIHHLSSLNRVTLDVSEKVLLEIGPLRHCWLSVFRLLPARMC